MSKKESKKKGISKEEAIKLWQSICSHNGAVISNTGEVGSRCALCGKMLFPNNPPYAQRTL